MKNKFAIVVSEFNPSITEKLLQGALSRLHECGISQDHITVIHVPGAVEIPLTAQLLARSHYYRAIICLGAVIRGETSHYDYVCEQVSQGCQQIMLDFSIPVIFGVLTTETEAQAQERVGGTQGHKGIDAANAALTMVAVVDRLQESS